MNVAEEQSERSRSVSSAIMCAVAILRDDIDDPTPPCNRSNSRHGCTRLRSGHTGAASNPLTQCAKHNLTLRESTADTRIRPMKWPLKRQSRATIRTSRTQRRPDQSTIQPLLQTTDSTT